MGKFRIRHILLQLKASSRSANAQNGLKVQKQHTTQVTVAQGLDVQKADELSKIEITKYNWEIASAIQNRYL